jgi:hypothetical protein
MSPAVATTLSYATALPNYWYYSEFAVSLAYPKYSNPFPRILSLWAFPTGKDHDDGA